METCCPVSCYICKPDKKDPEEPEDPVVTGGGDEPEEPVSGGKPDDEDEDTCFDDDQCLRNTWNDGKYNCADYAADYCEDEEYGAVMEACCPVSCYICKPTEKEPPTDPEPPVIDDTDDEEEPEEQPLPYQFVGCFEDADGADGEYGPGS